MENETPKCLKCGSTNFEVVVVTGHMVSNTGSDAGEEHIKEAVCQDCEKRYSAEELADLDWIDPFWNIIGE